MARRSALLASLLLVAALVSGCAHGRTRTARHIEAGEHQPSASLDISGPFVARASGGYMYGLGPGDLFAYGGMAVLYGGPTNAGLLSIDTGAGGRVYLGRYFHLEGELQYRYFPLVAAQDSGPDQAAPSLLVPRIGVMSSTAPNQRNFYGGLHAAGGFFLPADRVGGDGIGRYVVGMASAGFETFFEGAGSFQVELTLPFVRFGIFNQSYNLPVAGFLARWGRLSVGYNF